MNNLRYFKIQFVEKNGKTFVTMKKWRSCKVAFETARMINRHCIMNGRMIVSYDVITID